MKKLNAFLNVVIASFFGSFVGVTIANYIDYRTCPEIYEANSAPWYCHSALPCFVIFAVVTITCIVIKLIIRKKIR